jgi:hypothetical protein
MMKQLMVFLGPLSHSHLVGLLIAFFTFMAVTDVAAIQALIPRRMGLRWQAELLAATPILCVLGCLIAFLLSPVGNRSQYALIGGIGRIPVLGRYFIFAGIVCGAVLLLNLLLFFPVRSMKLSGNLSDESQMRLRQEVGEGVVVRDDKILFLEEKRAAVRRALQKEHIAFED